MKYFTQKQGSKRSSQDHRITALKTTPTMDGSSIYPILYFRVGDIWHGIQFENSGEAKVLMSEAARIHNTLDK